MKNIKKITAIILCFIFVLTAFSGCASEAQKAEVMAAFNELYPKSVEVNKIIYGEGLPASESFTEEELAALPVSHFVPVAEDSPYKTVNAIKEAILAVYTEDYYNDVLKFTAFEGYGENGSELAPRYKEMDGVLYVNVKFMSYDLSRGNRIVSEAVVKKLSGGVATIKTPYESNGKRTDKLLTMIYSESGWRLDDPTF